jgi:hypothetical protein
MERPVMQAKVIEVVETRGLILAVLQLLSGDVAIGMILSDSANRWRVTGISTAPVSAWHAGRRGINLQSLDGRTAPAVGVKLAEVQNA